MHGRARPVPRVMGCIGVGGSIGGQHVCDGGGGGSDEEGGVWVLKRRRRSKDEDEDE